MQALTLRQRIWIDSRIQGILVGRIIIYWLSTIGFFGIGIAVTQYCDHTDWSFVEHLTSWLGKVSPWLPSICLLLPLVIYDIVRTSHAFTGPISRVRQQLSKLMQNPNCTPLVLRQDDYLHEITAPLNSLQHQILSLHMALQKQREVIEELRNQKNAPIPSESELSAAPAYVAQIPKEDLETAQLMESITSAS